MRHTFYTQPDMIGFVGLRNLRVQIYGDLSYQKMTAYAVIFYPHFTSHYILRKYKRFYLID